MDVLKPTLLLVDDDPASISNLGDVLGPHYQLHTAVSKKSYAAARRIKPDAIVAEIATSTSDGLQLIRRIRKNPNLAATPIIILSVLNQDTDRILGYEALADLYLTKPFGAQELLASIRSLLRIRQLVAASPSPQSPLAGRAVRCEEDQRLLDRLDAVIQSRIDDPTLHVSALARACFLSQRQLERKLHEALGVSPSEYLRKVRMEQAWKWLDSGQYTSIGEVARTVGYQNKRSFQRAFQDVFGQNPSHLIRS